MTPDMLVSGRMEGLEIAYHYALTAGLCNDAVLRHNNDPVGAHILSRALTAGVLVATGGDARDRINVRWGYEGILRTVIADAGADGTVRGLVSPAQPGDAGDSSSLFGEAGHVQVVRSRGGTVTASGTVEACFLDAVDDLMAFLCMSDQVESSATVMVAFSDQPERPVRLCRGLLLQALPGCDLESFQRVRLRLDTAEVRGLLASETEPDQHMDYVLHTLTREEKTEHAWTRTVGPVPTFRCTCNAGKMSAVLRSLPYADRVEIVQKQEPVVVRCHFCNTQYTLDVDDCIRAWNEGGGK